ncbi:hypothetical protein GQ54DRAFT_77582 [Martensiomyces pterosporus]|nr:hypothetical protein GQ54DRAFT_77582 [Martensiomyces pterosporus]
MRMFLLEHAEALLTHNRATGKQPPRPPAGKSPCGLCLCQTGHTLFPSSSPSLALSLFYCPYPIFRFFRIATMRFRLRSLVRRVLQLATALLVLLSLGGLLLFTVFSFFPSINIPYLLPAQKVTRDTVFYRRSWREPFEYDIKVYASQTANATTHNTTAFFESAQLLWHVEPQSLEKKYPKYSTKVNVKLPESMLNETEWSTSKIYAHVFIQRSNQFTPHPNISDPHLVYTWVNIVSTAISSTYYTQPHSMLNGTSYTSERKRIIMCDSLLAWDLVLEDYTYTNETLPKVLRRSISDYPDEESKTGTYNPPLIYRPASGRWTMTAVPAESMPKPTGSNNQSSSPAKTDRITSLDVEFKIQGISQGWVRGEDAIRKLAEPKLERKTMTITKSPYNSWSITDYMYGDVSSRHIGPVNPTETASSDYIGSARSSTSDMGETGGHKSDAWVSMPENITEVEYTAHNSNFLPVYTLSNANALSVVLLVLSIPLVAALLLTALSDIVAFWSREDSKWEGTSRLATVLEVVYQCGNLVLMCMGYTMSGRSNILAYYYAGLSIWVFAALYNVPLNPFKWRQRIASLRAPASSEIPKPVLAGKDDSSSTATCVSGPPRVCGRDLAVSTQQETDQRFKKWLLWLSTPSLVLHLVNIATTSTGDGFRTSLIAAARSILHTTRMLQLLPQVVINYRTKSVAWIPITAYMCELLVNIHQMLAEWAFGWLGGFVFVPAGTNLVHCFLLAVLAVQWAKYYKVKQD